MHAIAHAMNDLENPACLLMHTLGIYMEELIALPYFPLHYMLHDKCCAHFAEGSSKVNEHATPYSRFSWGFIHKLSWCATSMLASYLQAQSDKTLKVSYYIYPT